jgi:hypothetical protein
LVPRVEQALQETPSAARKKAKSQLRQFVLVYPVPHVVQVEASLQTVQPGPIELQGEQVVPSTSRKYDESQLVHELPTYPWLQLEQSGPAEQRRQFRLTVEQAVQAPLLL